MKYAGKTFTLYASEPVAVQGSDSLYTYQNTGTGTATIVGSNNAVNWTSVATVVSGASYTGSHAYAFLMMTGSTEVSVSRGAAGDNSFSSSNPLPVAFSTATLVSLSGTITTGGTAQVLAASSAARKGWFLQNNSTGDLWVNRFGGAASAAQPSILIKAGRLYETPAGGSGGNALSIFGATTGQAFTAGEW